MTKRAPLPNQFDGIYLKLSSLVAGEAYPYDYSERLRLAQTAEAAYFFIGNIFAFYHESDIQALIRNTNSEKGPFDDAGIQTLTDDDLEIVEVIFSDTITLRKLFLKLDDDGQGALQIRLVLIADKFARALFDQFNDLTVFTELMEGLELENERVVRMTGYGRFFTDLISEYWNVQKLGHKMLSEAKLG